jgi:hypothetical protein
MTLLKLVTPQLDCTEDREPLQGLPQIGAAPAEPRNCAGQVLHFVIRRDAGFAGVGSRQRGLHGHVPSLAALQSALHAAETAPGVTAVESEIVLTIQENRSL